MARSLRISWENGQPRASFSHFMWRKPKTRQTNICSFFHNKHLREKTTNLREKTTALSLLRLYQLLFTCLLWKTTRHPLLVQFYTEQSKVQGICTRGGKINYYPRPTIMQWYTFLICFEPDPHIALGRWESGGRGATPADLGDVCSWISNARISDREAL